MVKGVANIGLRPTVGGTESRLEAHFFDFSADLYGQELAIALHHFIREERKFESFSALKEQIAADATQARALLDAAPSAKP
jgi:riboflavin kinase/FMN adenylyltransferase